MMEKLARQAGTYEGTLEVLRIRMESQIKYPSDNMAQVLQEYVDFIKQQLESVK